MIKLNTIVEGACIECGALTEAVMLYDGEAEFLCVVCQEQMRRA